jgi:hypothetical protein
MEQVAFQVVSGAPRREEPGVAPAHGRRSRAGSYAGLVLVAAIAVAWLVSRIVQRVRDRG